MKVSKVKRSFDIILLVIILLTISGNVNGQSIQSQFRLASKGEALLGLGPSCLFQIPSRGERSFPKLAELANLVPSYHLELGSDLNTIPSTVGKILSEVEQRAKSPMSSKSNHPHETITT